ncbi:AraC family transcriptional regulator [Janibacter sp. Soil728]|uniref:GlxA family transcriptional regulator n=1 Tax=Janibacter sp. Soil728 TaxID=1736393 RepID=UPI0006F64F43|nr:helix-turn-helix domain-containing protein [Janibacter sp. Soil728]KRE39150.1 AraC family transcriptional regulator [Janibacter sp. Soil728]
MRIAVHAFEGMTMFHLAAPLAVFGEVGRQGLASGWDPVVWTTDGRGIRTVEGLRIEDVSGPGAMEEAELVVLPAWPADLPATEDTLTAGIRAARDRGSQIAGLCLGAFPVVDSGVLDGREVVTHWEAVDQLHERRPGLMVNSAALYIDHGDVLTSAGTASAIDACLHIVRAHLGSAAAATVARTLVVAPHRDGDQAQYVIRPMPEREGVGHLGATIDWALSHLEEPLPVEVLAAHAGMSRRNFTRRFTEVTGSTPARWVMSHRLDEARRLLESTDRPIGSIATACGFASVVTFRQNFTAAYSTTPTSYRHRFTAPEAVGGGR